MAELLIFLVVSGFPCPPAGSELTYGEGDGRTSGLARFCALVATDERVANAVKHGRRHHDVECSKKGVVGVRGDGLLADDG
jgi:hypothetical protein